MHDYRFGQDPWNPNAYPITRFLSETGIQALPSLDSWLEVTKNVSDLQFRSLFVNNREHSGHQLDNMQ